MFTDTPFKNLDLYVDQGDTFSKTLVVRDSVGIVNLTGMTVEATVKRYFNTNKTYACSVSITNPTAGTVTFTMTEVQTAALNQDRYVYSIKLRSGNEAVRVFAGQLLVTPSSDAINISGNTYNTGNYNG